MVGESIALAIIFTIGLVGALGLAAYSVWKMYTLMDKVLVYVSSKDSVEAERTIAARDEHAFRMAQLSDIAAQETNVTNRHSMFEDYPVVKSATGIEYRAEDLEEMF